mgnify:CR=1 FL=1|nr:site-specific integrase [uncultured Blautia sp.]
MIRIKERITASAIWDIEGNEVRLAYRKEYPEPILARKIEEYRNVLKNKTYEQNNSSLCEAFQLFGGIAFVAIGMTCKDDFLACFAYYSKQLAAEWAEGEKRLKSKFVGYEYVFEIMLKNNHISIKYDYRYILDGVDGDQFCQINEKSFAEYWTASMLPLMEKGYSLAAVAGRVGDVRVSKYLMQMPEQATAYLRLIASAYTSRRELISANKMTQFIFGHDSRSRFIGGQSEFFTLLDDIISDESTLQSIKFIADNRKELNCAKDVWVLYQKHGTTLKYLSIDFTRVQKLSMRYELKCFLENRFLGEIRTSDRMFISLFDVANKLCNINRNINYFSDVDVTDIKKLQLSLEKEVSQSAIMTLFSACKTLYSYLCSDENGSKAPKPWRNPFDSIKFVNAKNYHENSQYMPESVVTAVFQHLNELNQTDQLVFRIFVETGMRAKEVAFLEEGCLSSARYDEAVMLSFIQYKTLKARRRNGLSDYHNIYISHELTELIQQQIDVSASLRKEHDLPYIFFHHNEGYKPAMLNVEYFAIKINELIKKHNICDESGEPWHFTSRQCRKTLVVNMIENGATINELVYQLGHLNSSTVMQYYAEVRAMKLAEMNSEFFKKQFDLLLSGKQLAEFSEEERRLLYVDFRLGNRRVELGFCTRKLCAGACKSRSRTVHCVNCSNLCTGRQYLSHWNTLLESQTERVQVLLTAYQEENLTEYEDFIEYKQEMRLMNAYQNVVTAIKESEAVR